MTYVGHSTAPDSTGSVRTPLRKTVATRLDDVDSVPGRSRTTSGTPDRRSLKMSYMGHEVVSSEASKALDFDAN